MVHRKRIDIQDPEELRQWTESFGVSREKLIEAVANVGTSAEKVRDFLQTH